MRNLGKLRKLVVAAMAALILAMGPASALAAEGRLVSLFSWRALVSGPVQFRTWAFTDTAGSRAEEDFILLAALGIFRGPSGPGGPAVPESIVTRAEMTAMVVRLLGQDLVAGTYASRSCPPPGEPGNLLGDCVPNPAAAYFTDADAIPEWARGYATAAYTLGMVKGLSDPEKGILFAADRPVRFGDAVSIVTRALLGRQWPEAVQADLEAVLTARLANDRDEPITREEMAILLVNALRAGRYNPDTGALDPERGLLHNNPFFSHRWLVTAISPEKGEMSALAEGEPGSRGPVRYLAQRVFLRGATDYRNLIGRRVTAIAGPEGILYIDAR